MQDHSFEQNMYRTLNFEIQQVYFEIVQLGIITQGSDENK